MRVFTPANQASLFKERWLKQYRGRDYRGCAAQVEALGHKPSVEEVNKIVGNKSWTECRCTECDQLVECMVELGQEPDYESATAWICVDCLRKALKLCDAECANED